MKWFKEQGWDVHVAANGQLELPFVDQKVDIPIQRSPLSSKNISAYQQLKALIDNNHYHIIHCHTPMGGVLARLASRDARRSGTKVIYTAHGFHFFKGAPLKNWFFYYPIEKRLAHYTDCLITINQEDYQLARTRGFKAGHIEHVHGVGVDTSHFHPINDEEKLDLRKSFGYQPNDFLMFYAAEFNQNKNQQLLIRALALIINDVPHAKLLLAGAGKLQKECQELVNELNISQQVDFLGYRDNIKPYLQMSDLAVGSSLREGLPVNIMEAMACGLPVVANDNRGHRELIGDGETGHLESNQSIENFAEKLKEVALDKERRKWLGLAGQSRIKNYYSVDRVLVELSDIYKLYMDGEGGLQWALH